jgi:hypothetical protein
MRWNVPVIHREDEHIKKSNHTEYYEKLRRRSEQRIKESIEFEISHDSEPIIEKRYLE